MARMHTTTPDGVKLTRGLIPGRHHGEIDGERVQVRKHDRGHFRWSVVRDGMVQFPEVLSHGTTRAEAIALAKQRIELERKIERPATIGELELLAGIERDVESRRAFWSQFEARVKTGDQVLKDGCLELRQRIRARVARGELNLI